MSGQASALGGCGLVGDVSHVLGAVVGDFDTDMRLFCREGCVESFLLTLREPITRGAQEKPDVVEGITCAPAVTGRVLPGATASLTWGVASECEDVTGVEDAGGVLELVKRWRFYILGRGPVSRSGYRSETVRRARPASSHARCQTFPGPGPLKWAVGWSFPRVRSTMPVSSRGPRRRRSWWCHTPLIDPGYPHACETGRVIRCGLQARLDVGPHGVPRGSSLAGQAQDSGSLEAQLSDRPADRPHTQTRPGSTYRVVLLDEGRDLAGGFAAHPAPFVPPDPHRDPGPGRVDHLHHHAPVTLCDHPTTWAASTAVTGLSVARQTTLTPSDRNQMETLQVNEQITPITTTRRHRAAAGRVRHRPRSLTTAGVEVRSSSRTSTSTRNPRPTPGHPHSTLKSQ